jgi:ketosteroid isomerase-like protein
MSALTIDSGRKIIMIRNPNKAIFLAMLFSVGILCAAGLSAQQNDDELLRAREAVWRAWFAGDTKTLEESVPPETIVMSAGEEKWKNQADVLRTSSEFHASGGKLVRLEFPRREVQHFGDVAIVWSSYVAETEENGKRSTDAGRITEIFVRQNGRWTNPGWHAGPKQAAQWSLGAFRGAKQAIR